MDERKRADGEPDIPRQAEQTLEREEKRGVPRGDHNLEGRAGEPDEEPPETSRGDSFTYGSDR